MGRRFRDPTRFRFRDPTRFRFRHPTSFLMKKKDKNVGGVNNINNFNGGDDGEKEIEMDLYEGKDLYDGKKEIVKDLYEGRELCQRLKKLLEQGNTESEFDDIRRNKIVEKILNSYNKSLAHLAHLRRGELKDKRDLGGGDGDNNGGGVSGGDDDNNGGGDDDNNGGGGGGGGDDNNGGGGGKNNKKGSDRDGDGNGDKYKSDRDSDGGGQMKGKNMDFRGKAGFGYKFGYHAGNEHEYQVGQLQCAQEVQSSEPKCWFYHPIMIS